MGKTKKTIKKKIGCSTIVFIVIFIFFVMFFGGGIFLASRYNIPSSTIIYTDSITFSKIGSSVYVDIKEWGLLGQHSGVFISDKKGENSGENNVLVLENQTMLLYKKIEPDSLEIYIHSLSYTEEENYNKTIGGVKLKVFKLKHSATKEYLETYKSKGLSRMN